MRRKLFRLCWLLLVPLLVCSGIAWSAEGVEEFVVQRMEPQGAVRGLREISLTFSAPVVPSEMVGRVLLKGDVPGTITPLLEGSWKWQDPQRCVFTPSRSLVAATEYRLSLRPDLRDLQGRLLAGGHDFTFRTPPVEFLGFSQRDFRSDGTIVGELRFSLPISPVRLRGYLEVRDETGKTISYSISQQHPSKKVDLYIQAQGKTKVVLSLFQGLPATVGHLGLAKDHKITVTPTFTLQIQDAYASSSYEGKGRIWVSTTSPVDISRASSFVEIEPKQSFSLEPGRGGFYVHGNFLPRDRVVVSIKKGLPGVRGASLKEPYRRAFIIPDMDPDLLFATGGSYLSPQGSRRIPLAGVNVEKIRLTSWKMYENNVPLALGMDNSWLDMELSRPGPSQEYRTDAKRNEPFRFSLDLAGFLSPDHGVYILQASDLAGNLWNDPRMMVTLTDLGITAKVFPKGIFVWVNSIARGTPVKDASVRIYSRSNQLLGTLTTDARGVGVLSRDEPWEKDLTPWVITASLEEDLSYLVLRYDLLRGGDWELGGRPYLDEGYEACVFTPRGVFRPGEVVELTGLVRNQDFMPPGEFPLEWLLFDPQGRKIFSQTAPLSPQGFVTLEYPLSDASPSGVYRVQLRTPGEGGTGVGEHSFLVEDFVPPRIKVTASTELKALAPEESVILDLHGEYLFGAPGANLATEGEVRFVPRSFLPKGYGDYLFDDPEVEVTPYSDYLGQGSLNEAGEGSFTWEAPPASTLPKPGDLVFRLGVMEDGGRMVWDVLSLPYHPSSRYVGVRPPKGQELRPLREITFPLVALDWEGNLSDRVLVNTQFFKVVYHSVVVEEDGRYRFHYERELLPFAVEGVPLEKGIGEVAFTPQEYGEYLLRVEDAQGNARTALSFYVWGGSEGPPGGPLDKVSLRLDKEMYSLGDNATLRCELPFEGNLLVTVETDRVVHSQYLPGVAHTVDLSIPIEKSMLPNAYCVAWLIRPQGADNSQWHNPRALGVTRFRVDQSERKAQVLLAVPDRAFPEREVTVDLQLKDASGKPFLGEAVIALVDEGILGLTKFSTPDPYAFFTALRALSTRGYDLYDDLLPPEKEATPLLHPAGGEGRAMAFMKGLSPVQARRFKPVALFDGPLTTDETGHLQARFHLPEFSGTLRVMAVAGGGSFVGGAEKNLLVARDVILESSLPRALAPGDSFSMPMTLFSKSKEHLAVEVHITAEEPLVYKGPEMFRLTLAPESQGERMNIPLSTSKSSGVGRLKLTASWNDESMEQVTELPVRPPYPLIRTYGGGALEGGATVTLDFGSSWFPGTLRGVAAFSGTPVADLSTALQYLTSYPYGCLEQTISGIWPLVALGDLVQDLDPLLVNPQENRRRVEEGLRRILAMQLYDGSFSFWPGDGYSFSWGSVYAAHLLLEASQEGYDIPQEGLRGALEWIRRLLPQEYDGMGDAEYAHLTATKAYGMYVLALSGEAPLAWMEHFRDRSEKLTDTARIFLGGAYALAGRQDVASSLLGTTALPLDTPPSGGGTFDSGVRNTALRLLMRLHLDPRSEQAALLAQQLIQAAQKGLWRNTQDNAFSAVALGRYFRSTREDRKPFVAKLHAAPEEELLTVRQGENASISVESLESPQLSCAGEGRVYYSWSVEGVPMEAPKPMKQGLSVSRSYHRRDGVPLKPGEKVNQGEMLEVRLELLSNRNVEHLVVADLLPGGLEIDNPRLQAALEGSQRYASVREEIRDDRLLLFVPSLEKGEVLQYTYRVRAVTAGTFTVPPIAAEAMYDPALQALGETGTLEIRP
jgi:uncharacterized protein YfaS (alpha-2-macroglobulin family)